MSDIGSRRRGRSVASSSKNIRESSLWEQVAEFYLQKFGKDQAKIELLKLKDQETFLRFDFLYPNKVLLDTSMVAKVNQVKPYVLPPSVYASTADWRTSVRNIRRYYREGGKEELINGYLNQTIEEKQEYICNIQELLQEQLNMFYRLTEQTDQLARKKQIITAPKDQQMNISMESFDTADTMNIDTEEEELKT